MNTTLSKFLGMAITVVTISAFLFIAGYKLIGTETNTYSTKITGQQSNLPSGSGTSTPTTPTTP